MKQLDARARLLHVVQAGEKVQRFLAGKTFDDYRQDDLLRSAVERQFTIIGEAMREALRADPRWRNESKARGASSISATSSRTTAKASAIRQSGPTSRPISPASSPKSARCSLLRERDLRDLH
ncbi:MAG TPA: HepT-like ribonuclease domain-containing protein [Thermoanaerobaculia bacterium]|jgi:hypothetical protein